MNSTWIDHHTSQVVMNQTTSTLAPYQPLAFSHPLMRAGDLLVAVCHKLMFVMGNVGNILSFIIMGRKGFSESTTSIYFRVMAGDYALSRMVVQIDNFVFF